MNRTLRIRTRAQLAVHALWDQMSRPKAILESDVPWHPEAITPAWITSVLGAEVPGAMVEDVKLTGGDDGSSVRRSIEITWNTAGKAAALPTQLFTKTTPGLATRLSAGMAAPSEGRFLRELRPRLNIEAPVCLHTARDPASGRSIHLFEDLTYTRDATFCRVDTVINRHQAESIIDTLSQLHGVFMQGARNGIPIDEVAWLGTYEQFFQAGLSSGIQMAHEEAMVKALPVIPPGLRERCDEIWPGALRAVAAHGDAQPTVIHSDVHLGNWYITGKGQMGLSDWARVCRGLWARDVSYALMTTLTVKNRRSWEDGLLHRYLENLRRDFGIGLDMAHAYKLYCQQAFTALLMWTPTLCPPPMLPDMQPEAMSMEMIKRIATGH